MESNNTLACSTDYILKSKISFYGGKNFWYSSINIPSEVNVGFNVYDTQSPYKQFLVCDLKEARSKALLFFILYFFRH